MHPKIYTNQVPEIMITIEDADSNGNWGRFVIRVQQKGGDLPPWNLYTINIIRIYFLEIPKLADNSNYVKMFSGSKP